MGQQARYFTWMLDSIERLQSVSGAVELNTAISDAVAQFGYTQFCFFAVGNPLYAPQRKLFLRSWPADWSAMYLAGGYAQNDPVSRTIQSSAKSFRWSDVGGDDARANEIMTIAAVDFRMREGVTVPIHGLYGPQAAASFAGADVENTREAIALIETITGFVFSKYSRMNVRKKLLSPREREVMSWIAAGKSAWDVGVILHISDETVKKHIASAMRKLDVVSRAQAVAESIRTGEIQP